MARCVSVAPDVDMLTINNCCVLYVCVPLVIYLDMVSEVRW